MGEFPLFRAIRSGHLETVKFLLDNGADPNIPDRVSVAEHYSLYAAKMQFRNRGNLLLSVSDIFVINNMCTCMYMCRYMYLVPYKSFKAEL